MSTNAKSAVEVDFSKIILRLFVADNFPLLTANEIIRYFPNYLEDAAFVELTKMTDKGILQKANKDGTTRFFVNTHMTEVLQNYFTKRHIISNPMPDQVPVDFDPNPVFVTEGSKRLKGITGRYFYYRKLNDPFHYCVLLHTRIDKQPAKKDLGSLNDKDSILSKVWYTINFRLGKRTFYKAELDDIIPDRRIVQNRQPIKAAIDVLEFMQYIRKTGNKFGVSFEYEIING